MTVRFEFERNWVTGVEKSCAPALDGICQPIAERVADRARAAENAHYGAHVHVVKTVGRKRRGGEPRQAGYTVLATGAHAMAVEAKRGTLARALTGGT